MRVSLPVKDPQSLRQSVLLQVMQMKLCPPTLERQPRFERSGIPINLPRFKRLHTRRRRRQPSPLTSVLIGPVFERFDVHSPKPPVSLSGSCYDDTTHLIAAERMAASKRDTRGLLTALEQRGNQTPTRLTEEQQTQTRREENDCLASELERPATVSCETQTLSTTAEETRDRCAEMRQELEAKISTTKEMEKQWEETVNRLFVKLEEQQRGTAMRQIDKISRQTTALEGVLGEERNRCAELREELNAERSQRKTTKKQWEETVVDLRSKLEQKSSQLRDTEEASRRTEQQWEETVMDLRSKLATSGPRERHPRAEIWQELGAEISQTEREWEMTLTSLRSELEAQKESSQLLKACAMRQAQEASHARKALESALAEERGRSAQMMQQIQGLERTNECLLERLDGDTLEAGEEDHRRRRHSDDDWDVISSLKVKLEDEIVKSGALRTRLHHSESLRMQQMRNDPDELSSVFSEAVNLAEVLLAQREQLQAELASLRDTDLASPYLGIEKPFLRPASPTVDCGNCSSDSGLLSDGMFDESDEAVDREIAELRNTLPATSPLPFRACRRPPGLQREGVQLQRNLDERSSVTMRLVEKALSQMEAGSLETPPPNWQHEPADLDSD
ncbi:MAG: hypothetical protein KVP17_004946 [Porospora cf. gigantea B]|nr:MAG: hypothetical protein KVP17_004946 [Porospora cf. gigantea B]